MIKSKKLENAFTCKKELNSFWNEIPTCYNCNENLSCSKSTNICNNIAIENKTYLYVFIFTQPDSKTSIQFNELISLLRKYSHNDTLINIIEYSSSRLYDPLNYDYYRAELIKFKNSCILKSNFKIDLGRIIYYSGYIYSCGILVNCEKWEKVNTEKLVSNLENYISQINKKTDVVFYTDTDNGNLKSKVKGILIDKERSYLGPKFFSKEIKNIKTIINGFTTDKGLKGPIQEYILIYRDESKKISNEYYLYDDQSTLNMMIAYHVFYKKDDPLHLLDMQDEAKPYWAGIYTTPHNLTNAMFNLAQLEEGSIILDPFLHTGTSILEAAKYNCTIIGSDLFEATGAKDNVDLLLNKNALAKCISSIDKKIYDNNLLNTIVNIINSEIKESNNKAFNDFNYIETIKDKYTILDKIDNRVIFYIIRRYFLRSFQGIRQKVDDLQNESPYVEKHMLPYQIYLEQHKNLLKEYLNLLEYSSKSKNLDGWMPTDKTIKNSLVDDLDIYKFKRVSPFKCDKFSYQIIQCDAKKLCIADNSIDAIITDPPYGYGDDISQKDLEDLYICFIKEAFRVLSNNGRLIMCALDKVKTGKPMHENTTSWGVVNLIDKIAKEMGILFVKKDLLPITGPWFIDYWKSEHALNRVVINLQIFKPIKESKLER